MGSGGRTEDLLKELQQGELYLGGNVLYLDPLRVSTLVVYCTLALRNVPIGGTK